MSAEYFTIIKVINSFNKIGFYLVTTVGKNAIAGSDFKGVNSVRTNGYSKIILRKFPGIKTKAGEVGKHYV